MFSRHLVIKLSKTRRRDLCSYLRNNFPQSFFRVCLFICTRNSQPSLSRYSDTYLSAYLFCAKAIEFAWFYRSLLVRTCDNWIVNPIKQSRLWKRSQYDSWMCEENYTYSNSPTQQQNVLFILFVVKIYILSNYIGYHAAFLLDK